MTYKEWATPLTIGSFVLIAVTGVLMFFHLDSGLNKAAHEWLGWAMLAGAVLHGTQHMKSLKRHFARPGALALIGVFVALLAASFISPPGKPDKPPYQLVTQAVLDAPLAQVAALAGKDTQALLTQLNAAGIPADAGESLRKATGPARNDQMKGLGIIFSDTR